MPNIVPARKIRTGDRLADGLVVWSVEGDPVDGVKLYLANSSGTPVQTITVDGDELVAVEIAHVLRPDADELAAYLMAAACRLKRIGFKVSTVGGDGGLRVWYPGLSEKDLFDVVKANVSDSVRVSIMGETPVGDDDVAAVVRVSR